jgi:thiamine pyrophosphate-dependent acetolactate synthase large subunit-like protein
MFADVAVFAQEASAPAQVRHLIDRCVRVARASNGPTVLILPKDIQDEDYEEPAVAHGSPVRAWATASQKSCPKRPISQRQPKS